MIVYIFLQVAPRERGEGEVQSTATPREGQALGVVETVRSGQGTSEGSGENQYAVRLARQVC